MKLALIRGGSVLTLIMLLPATAAFAQAPQGAQSPAQSAWSFHASAAAYFFDDDDDYLQPTFTADRGSLHLEARYNYEDQESVSGFIGWNFEVDNRLTLAVTPMFGAVGGKTDGVIPALELTLGFRRFELYSEGEYVFDLNESDDSFLYNWSEVSVWATDWLRAGLVLQRTRAHEQPRDVQRGLLTGVLFGRLEAAAYFFNPGADDNFFVASLGVSF